MSFGVLSAESPIPVHAVQVEPSIREVTDGSFRSRPSEIRKIDVGDGERLDVLARLSGDAIPGKWEIARGKDA